VYLVLQRRRDCYKKQVMHTLYLTLVLDCHFPVLFSPAPLIPIHAHILTCSDDQDMSDGKQFMCPVTDPTWSSMSGITTLARCGPALMAW